MKKIALIFLLLTSPAFAGPTQAVFSITSSATTSTANLRVTPMGKFVGADGDKRTIQTFVWEKGKTQNLFLTKTQTVPLYDALCLWLQADQDTNMAIDSETAVMKLYSGVEKIICFDRGK